MGYLITAFLFVWIFVVGMGGGEKMGISFGFWLLVTLAGIALLIGRFFFSGGSTSDSPKSKSQDPSFDQDSPSRVRTNWNDKGFRKR